MARGERQERFWMAVDRWASANNARFGLPSYYETSHTRAVIRFGLRHPVLGAVLVGTELTVAGLAFALVAFAVDRRPLSFHAAWMVATILEAFGVVVCFSYYHYARRQGEPPLPNP